MTGCASERRDFGLRLIQLGRQWRNAVDAELRRFGLTAATWRPLFHLGNLGDGMQPKDLAEALDMERPSLGQLLDRLEKRGLVTRRETAEDRRCKTIHLTEEGWKVYHQTVQASSMVAGCLMGEVSDAELAVCHRVFGLVRDAAQHFDVNGDEA
ncbi:MAG TPA: MarR family transcriptional regulator [Patescibacteria group bacterium]|nr:MarR family transcriptional regulator [Patescibacteria group bacterium]